VRPERDGSDKCEQTYHQSDEPDEINSIRLNLLVDSIILDERILLLSAGVGKREPRKEFLPFAERTSSAHCRGVSNRTVN